jgi:hypothetical protein
MINEPRDDAVDEAGRRAFLQRMVGTAFAVPVVTSFSMSVLSHDLHAQASNLSPGFGGNGSG